MIALATQLWGNPTEKKAHEYRFGKNRSKKLDLAGERWYDNEAQKGGGYEQLYELVHGHKPTNGNGHARHERRGQPRQDTTEPGWRQCMMPPPADAMSPTQRQLNCTTLYEYCDFDDRLLCYVRRIERDGGKKAFYPLTYGWYTGTDGRSALGWHSAAPPSPRPLYRLNALSHADPGATVLLCEGEKAAEAAQRLFPDMVGMAWMGGTGQVRQADLGPLEGRSVILWPDADDAGLTAMRSVKEALPRARMLSVDGLPAKFDAADLELERIKDPDAWLRERLPPRDHIDEHEIPKIPWIDRRIADRTEEDLPERLWVVPDWIPREQVTGIYGPPGVNKTDFLVQLLMALSAGLVFMGYQLEQVPVYGLFCEDTDVEIWRRAARIAAHYGMRLSDFPDFHFSSLVGYDDLEFITFDNNTMLESRALKRFDMKIAATGAAFACLDTAPHFFGGNENDRRQVSRFLRKLDAISINRSCGVAITAHPSARGRTSGRMESGSTGWEGGVRARLALTKPDQEAEEGKPPPDTNDRTLTLWKSNYAPPGKMLDLVWEKGVFTTAALDPEKAKARGAGANAACEEKFMELLAEHFARGVYVNTVVHAHASYAPLVFYIASGQAFSIAQFKRAMEKLTGKNAIRIETYGPSSRTRQRFAIV
jgi:RecA-family ATPase